MTGKFHADPVLAAALTGAAIAQIIAPGIVAVARQDDKVGVGPKRRVVQAVARRRIAVPAVHIIGQARLRGSDRAGQRLAHDLRRVGGHPIGRVGRKTAIAHDHLLGQDLPGGACLFGFAEPVIEPFFLRRAHQRTVLRAPGAIAEVGERLGDVPAPGDRFAHVQLLVAPGDPGFGTEDGGQRTDLETVIHRVGNGHPFAIDLLRRRLAHGPFAFLVGLMIFRAVPIGVVRQFMIVPLGNHREGGVQRLKIGIEPVRGVAQAIIGQRHHLVRRFDDAAGHRLLQAGIMAAIIFVEIVAAMDDQVDIVPRGGMAIGVEIAKGQVGAGKETDAEAGYVPLRQGAGAADPADPAIGGDEAVEIPLARLKAGNGYFRGVIGIGAGRDFAARHDLRKGRVGRDLDAQLAVA